MVYSQFSKTVQPPSERFIMRGVPTVQESQSSAKVGIKQQNTNKTKQINKKYE